DAGLYIRLGDLHAKRQQFREADEAYAKAAARDPAEPLALYLQGWARQRAGQTVEGEALIEQARYLSLGDAAKRATVAEEVTKRDLTDLARREREIVHALGWHRAWSAGNYLVSMAREAATRKDFARAADGYERILLAIMASDRQFAEYSAYLGVPALAHAYRARAALAADKLDRVRAEADTCLALTPGNMDLALLIVPELAKRGRQADADALYERAAEPYRDL